MPGNGTAARPPSDHSSLELSRTQQALPGPLPLRCPQSQGLLAVLRNPQLQRALLVRLGARALRVAEGVRGRHGDLAERRSFRRRRRGDGRRHGGRRNRRPARRSPRRENRSARSPRRPRMPSATRSARAPRRTSSARCSCASRRIARRPWRCVGRSSRRGRKEYV